MIGTKLGNRYELLEKVGEGGMATVYKAKCHYLNRFVAIKILKEQFCSDKEFVEKFKREATSVASLSDNNIVNIYDVGSENNIHYIVMEYVDGKTLKELIVEKGKIDPKETVRISKQIASALVCAHRNNIIHRDIKPHNILVTKEGIVKVTDFGIAKASNSATITNSSKVMGSAHYFSPEQAKGSFVDSRTDIYSLGIVMYEMLVGKVPFDGESPVSVAVKHIQNEVVAPKEIDDKIPEGLNSLVLKCLEKNPVKRYQTIKNLEEDLARIENNENILNGSSNISENDVTRVMDTAVINDKIKEMAQNDEYEDDDEEYEDDDEEYEDEEDEIEDKKKRSNKGKTNKKLILGIAMAVLFLVVGSVSAYLAFNKSGGKKVEVPNVVGLTKEEAEKVLSEKKLKLVVAQKVKNEKKEGTIIESYPKSGEKVAENSEVRVSISSGNVVVVPNLKGMELEAAKKAIQDLKLKVGNVKYEFNDNVASGKVISQTPDIDAELKEGEEISLVISNGPEIKYSTVPNLIGKSIDGAQNALANAGLSMGGSKAIITEDQSLDGQVASQSIGAGQSIKQGSSVSISYYKYKKPEPKPDPKPDTDTGKDPGTDTGKNPGTDTGKDPGTDTGKDPGTDTGKDPGTDPGTDTGKDPGTDTGKDSGTTPKK
ncbi:Stk1 family PASTA domain-containing Ser/Thr kinase [Clostridium botulinum]|uniref:Stk1 family PASTA domain-containing Ser/Thr kinase n=1 Tax=Clostridium botulinum TaxID=1491 RepID=UPI0007743B26|nr:Stk1 family PASTA domain-containing Ser/Thr kinase [Clostridium botulinum]MBY6952285.1 Stk1 family PASTA domain-containing Ser/Thr kinase [Clostridium botulinum]MCR1137880.1 Stk1 family PASTA domain-containing Ser/Thr kinase [Clostridium botulinum]NEZ79107.1 Stk1 family PASTA domain-containing Ser/Thr kinase [Clostridium botulinum]NFA17612.1 Stk1 family PASTA domain-containing Ser/Thr kinase [Clostridium botulinum]NFA53892.1 Stk1 family PASTA domain-containing Ser/Thr kinase [Clostridium bo